MTRVLQLDGLQEYCVRLCLLEGIIAPFPRYHGGAYEALRSVDEERRAVTSALSHKYVSFNMTRAAVLFPVHASDWISPAVYDLHGHGILVFL